MDAGIHIAGTPHYLFLFQTSTFKYEPKIKLQGMNQDKEVQMAWRIPKLCFL